MESTSFFSSGRSLPVGAPHPVNATDMQMRMVAILRMCES
jgi:hypothetical protein